MEIIDSLMIMLTVFTSFFFSTFYAMKLILVGASFAFLGSVGRGNRDATFKVRGFQEIPFPVNSRDILFTHFYKSKK